MVTYTVHVDGIVVGGSGLSGIGTENLFGTGAGSLSGNRAGDGSK